MLEKFKNFQENNDDGLQEQSKDNFSLKETNLIQVKLIEKSGEDPIDWISKNASNFRKIIESNPDLIKQYRKNSEIVENIINEQLEKSPTTPRVV